MLSSRVLVGSIRIQQNWGRDQFSKYDTDLVNSTEFISATVLKWQHCTGDTTTMLSVFRFTIYGQFIMCV